MRAVSGVSTYQTRCQTSKKIKAGLRIRIQCESESSFPFKADPDTTFHFKRVRMRIRLLIEEMQMYWPPQSTPQLWASRVLQVSIFEPIKLLNFDYNADPDPVFHSDPDQAFPSNVDKDPQPWIKEYSNVRTTTSLSCRRFEVLHTATGVISLKATSLTCGLWSHTATSHTCRRLKSHSNQSYL